MIDSKSKTYPPVGNLDLLGIYSTDLEEGLGRVLGLLSYFAQSSSADDREIVLERIHTSAYGKIEGSLKISKTNFHVDAKRMEDFNAKGFTDFANKFLQIHQIIPSATQEEVLFTACPELFVAMLYSPEMKDDEVIVIRNVRRFVEYKGYLATFEFAGAFASPQPIIDVLAIDAVHRNHFSKQSVDRDIAKAFTAFSAIDPSESIVTGHWLAPFNSGAAVYLVAIKLINFYTKLLLLLLPTANYVTRYLLMRYWLKSLEDCWTRWTDKPLNNCTPV